MKNFLLDCLFPFFSVSVGTFFIYLVMKFSYCQDTKYQVKQAQKARFIYVKSCMIEDKKDNFYPGSILKDKITGTEYLKYKNSITKIN